MIEFEESGMRFIFDEKKSFHIEKSPVYRKLSSSGIKSVECIVTRIYRKERNVLLIEAKQSTPNPRNYDGKLALRKFLEDVSKKNMDSLQLCYASLHGLWNTAEDLGVDLAEALRRDPKIKCVLIVKGYETEWCQKMKELLHAHMRDWLRLWKADIWVLTEAQARKFKLVHCGDM